ncbi:hypothetical protein RJ639_016366 [Escallonia herrerae]|uniref:N6-adenosine-methyltransferase MT-A70-like n=1 Tax=Escallonia herrerae TaxID=1293975 RepID=A0AA88VB87_9ASTE|nr:hypothetical protein RJ639_016366 [Escallonia herrerae]
METQSDGNEDMAAVKEMGQQIESRVDTLHNAQLDLIASLQTLIPDIASSIDLSVRVISAFNHRPFTPLPRNPNPNFSSKFQSPHTPEKSSNLKSNQQVKPLPEVSNRLQVADKFSIDESGGPLEVVRSMVAVCLLEPVAFKPTDSSAVLRRLEGDEKVTMGEKAALRELGGESGAILAVETALRSMAEDNGGVELEDFVVSGKPRVMVMAIDRSRLVKELPEGKQNELSLSNRNAVQVQQAGMSGGEANGGGFGMGGTMPRPMVMPDMWMGLGDPHLSGLPPVFHGGGGPGSMMMGPRGGPRGMMGMARGMGVHPIHRPPLGPNAAISSPNAHSKARTEEDDMKDLEALLNKKTFREMQKSKTGEELLDLIHRPTARETAVAAKFKSKGGSQVKEYCTALTKEDCRRQSGSYIACEKVSYGCLQKASSDAPQVHFRRIIALHTDINLGDCSFLDTCRHMKTCKYVHYELDSTPDMPHMTGAAALPPPKPLKPQRAEYCSEVELGESQWINCDIRNFRMDILGQYGVIMADPPWDIHMELPYGTMADDEMRNLNVPALQTDGLIFLWVTGRAMELGRECLELWGYTRCEEIIWVKTNQLQRIIRTGRTGHWLNHSKEHCLVGIKGNPEVNRNIDTDVIVAEVRETSRKPDEMYPMLERISPRTRKLELFARMHNTHAGWMSLGNQLSGVRLVDEGLRARFKAAYPEVEVQPQSPPRASAMEEDTSVAQMRSPFVGAESKSISAQFADVRAPETAYVSEEKPANVDVEMTD